MFQRVTELRRYARAIGWPAALKLRIWEAKVRVGLSDQAVIALRLKGIQFPLRLRTQTSDRDVLRQVFVDAEYSGVEVVDVRTVIDLGANVGYSAAYFLSKYPGATVIAVEPDPDNYAICCRNLAGYGSRASVIQGAAWPERRKLVLDKGTYRDGREWATRVRERTESRGSDGSGPEVEGYDVLTLLEMSGFHEVDLLKVDIERSELQLFSTHTEAWLPRVKNICIELHDPACTEMFFRAIADFNYRLIRKDDVTICLGFRRKQAGS